MKSVFVSALIAMIAIGCSSSEKKAPPPWPTTLQEATGSAFRTAENTQRDQYRHPVETLTFFGLQPQMTVIEISPGTGWYLEILAPYLEPQGKYIAATAPSANEYLTKMNEQVKGKLAAFPKASTVTFDPTNNLDIVPPGTADMVLTFRNVHNWMANDSAQAAFNSFFKALKAGGILGVVEHRASPKGKQDPKAKSGYVQELHVIKLAEKAGFKLLAKSEVNANPKDTKNYPDGVWTLPPTLRLKEKDRDKYLAIGESDRMTLKFVKP